MYIEQTSLFKLDKDNELSNLTEISNHVPPKSHI